MANSLPAIPAKRYFTIGEVSDLCGVKPYVLRYWEQEFTQLKPMKRRGNRRYYQHHEVLLIRRIRELLYDQGFTISGARNRLSDLGAVAASGADAEPFDGPADEVIDADAVLSAARQADAPELGEAPGARVAAKPDGDSVPLLPHALRMELLSIREILTL
jgi:DNA-binding transcriptional MerR regulator